MPERISSGFTDQALGEVSHCFSVPSWLHTNTAGPAMQHSGAGGQHRGRRGKGRAAEKADRGEHRRYVGSPGRAPPTTQQRSRSRHVVGCRSRIKVGVVAMTIKIVRPMRSSDSSKKRQVSVDMLAAVRGHSGCCLHTKLFFTYSKQSFFCFVLLHKKSREKFDMSAVVFPSQWYISCCFFSLSCLSFHP